MPVIYGAGGAFSSSQNAMTLALPTGFQPGWLHMMFVETANEPMAAITGWANVGAGVFNIATGTVTGLHVRYRVAVGGDANVAIADSGDHQGGIIHGFSGQDGTTIFDTGTGAPVFSSDSTTGTTLSFPTLTTTVADCMIVHAVSTGLDTTTNQINGTATNANLTGLTTRNANWFTAANGGGLAVFTGVKATAGSIGTTTVPIRTGSGPRVIFTCAIRPSGGGVAATFAPPPENNHRRLLTRMFTG